MTVKRLHCALAAAAMAAAGTAQAAGVASDPSRVGSPVAASEQLRGDTGLIAVLIGVAAILAILVFDSDDSDDLPTSP